MNTPLFPKKNPSAILTREQWQEITDYMGLARRGAQMVRGIFDGLHEVEIADRHNITAHTVHTHIKRLYRRLGVSDQRELIVRIFATYLALQQPKRLKAEEAAGKVPTMRTIRRMIESRRAASRTSSRGARRMTSSRRVKRRTTTRSRSR